MGKKGKVRVKQKGGAGAANINPLADLMQPPAEDMIMPPQRGDPNVSIPWPSSKYIGFRFVGMFVWCDVCF